MRILALALVVVAVALQYPLWLGKGGWLRVWDLDRQLAIQRAGNAKLQARNDALDAKNYDFIGTNPAKSPFRQNQYGFTLGGPISIPKVFNGKNRLFFMTNYEALRARTTRVTNATTFTQAMRDGNFSAVPTQLRDPLSRTGSGATATAA